MEKLEVFRKDISEIDTFTFQDTIVKKLDYNPTTDIYLFGRYNTTGRCKNMLMGYEVIKPKKYKNPDGSIVRTYPSTSEFGTYGSYLPCTANQYWIDCIMNGLPVDRTKVTGKCWNIKKYQWLGE